MDQPDRVDVTRWETTDVTPDDDAILVSLRRILDSPEFAGAERIRSFLTYIVEESLAGRGDLIRGKTILDDVYGRSPLEGRDPMAVVRVDSGRLRRRLSDYYAGSGRDDALRIHVNPGGYAPRFAVLPPDTWTGPVSTPPAQTQRSRIVALALLTILGSVTVTTILWTVVPPHWIQRASEPEVSTEAVLPSADRSSRAIREALFASSPARLQAASLSVRARGLLFPALERRWLEIVLEMFKLTIEMDENYYGGHAGAAQAEALIAITLPQGEERGERVRRASVSASRAMDLGIEQSWSHSALALVAVVEGDYDQALKQSAIAVSLDPEDLDSLNLQSLILLFSGEFGRAIEVAELVDARSGPERHYPSRSIMGTANFHMGNFEAALEFFDEFAAAGDPFSPISLGYLIATNVRLERLGDAEEMLGLLERAWPGVPLDGLYRSLYRDPSHAQEVIDALTEAGWAGPALPRNPSSTVDQSPAEPEEER